LRGYKPNDQQGVVIDKQMEIFDEPLYCMCAQDDASYLVDVYKERLRLMEILHQREMQNKCICVAVHDGRRAANFLVEYSNLPATQHSNWNLVFRNVKSLLVYQKTHNPQALAIASLLMHATNGIAVRCEMRTLPTLDFAMSYTGELSAGNVWFVQYSIIRDPTLAVGSRVKSRLNKHAKKAANAHNAGGGVVDGAP
jgi:hypothetical protein